MESIKSNKDSYCMIFSQRGLTVNHTADPRTPSCQWSPWTHPQAGIWEKQDLLESFQTPISESVSQTTSKPSRVRHRGAQAMGALTPRCPSHPGHPQGLPGPGGCSWSIGGSCTWFWSPVLCFRAQSGTDKPGNIPLSDGLTPPCQAQAFRGAFHLCSVHLWRAPTAARSAKCCALVLGMSPGPGHHPHCQGCPCPEAPGEDQGRGQKGTVTFCTGTSHRTSYLKLLSFGGVTVSPQSMYLNMGFISFPRAR